jgi:hypothetical protein
MNGVQMTAASLQQLHIKFQACVNVNPMQGLAGRGICSGLGCMRVGWNFCFPFLSWIHFKSNVKPATERDPKEH